MSGNGGSAHLDRAIIAITQARNENEIALLLAEFGTVLTGADAAEVVEIGDDGGRRVSHSLPCPDLYAGLGTEDWSRIVRGALDGPTVISPAVISPTVISPTGTPPSARTRVVTCVPVFSDAPLLPDAPVLADVPAFPGARTRSALLLAGRPARDGLDEVTLLAEVAAAAAESITARRSLRLHSEQLGLLGARLMTLADRNIDDDLGPAPQPEDDTATTTADLTDREREILEVVVSGASNSQIAERFTISVETVKSHVKRILRKLNAANRSELIARYGGLGSAVTAPNPPPPHGSRPDPR
ncbi:helix-turn-helix transcriptional regulator [Gordonia sp. NB41Y]|uniref:helix-turn-helix transcriptional regulator n=1 Tax=Gordonia sp. NB41Y TaxID=875808 RepID=UPI0021C9CB46|nr:helix-turn-helix transcriptional regulator [Gordonia sp. NB41Y]WLP89008.1 helix-turn-helix transcriptional regulator [Gordonia sp. NB41Y]